MRLAYVTGTRADFGLMRRALLGILAVAEVGVHVTGMHLDATFGHTLDEVEASGLAVLSKTPGPMGHRDGAASGYAIADALNGFVRAFAAQRPDAVLLLGDRGEMMAGALAALHLGIASVHIHGGERSATVDEPIRHAISKLCSEHWVATPASAQRLARMGESAHAIHVMGAPGLDGIVQDAELGTDALNRRLKQQLGLTHGQPFLLGLFHPADCDDERAFEQTQAVLSGCHAAGLPMLWVGSNADAGSVGVAQALRGEGTLVLPHLPRTEFCAAMAQCAVMVGNSSAGIIEAASWSTPVINVGMRQHLRERSANVVDVEAAQVGQAVQHALSLGRPVVHNVYGDGRATERMLARLREWRLPLDCSKRNAY